MVQNIEGEIELYISKIRGIFLVFLYLFLVGFVQARELKNVSLQLLWKHQFEFAGYYMAKEKGFYRDFGLSVDIKEYKAGMNPVDEVLNGNSQFAIGRSSLILDIANGKKILMMNALLQASPQAFVTLDRDDIKSVSDFLGKKVMMSKGYSNEVAIDSMLMSNGVEPSKLDIIKPSFNVEDLIKKRVDIMFIYLSNEIYKLKEKGIKYRLFKPEDYGFDDFDDLLFTSQKEFKNNPVEVINFNKASLKGWKYAFSHIDETISLILKKYNTQHKTKEALLFEANTLKKLAYHKTKVLGRIGLNRVKTLYNLYELLGLAKKKVDFKNSILNFALGDKFDTKLTLKEMIKLYGKNPIRVCTNNDWMPIEFMQKDKPQGISIDTLKLISEKSGLKLKFIKTKNWKESQKFLKERKCDLLPSAIKTSKREKYANFTKPYLNYKLVIITNKNEPIVRDLETIVTKTMSRKKGSGLITKLKKKYPKINIVETKSYKESFDFVKDKKVYFTISTLPVLLYYSGLYGYDFQITGYTDMTYRLCMAVRKDKPILLKILDTYLSKIPPSESRLIFEKWTKQKIVKRYDYSYLIRSVVIFIVIVSLILLYVFKLRGEISKRKIAQKELVEQKKLLYRQANYDELTNLPNHRLFLKMLDEVIKLEKDKKFALFIINIDRLKFINDSFGYDIGDRIIIEFTKIIQNITNQQFVLARLVGDEFAMIARDISSVDSAAKLAENINDTLLKPLKINGYNIHVSCCMGISVYPNDTKDPKGLLTYADIAMTRAKKSGKGSYLLHNPDASSLIFEKAMMESSLRDAIKKEEFIVYFQPQIDALSEKLIGMEALVRWKHPKIGLIFPDKFIPLAEDIGMIVDIDKIVMKKAMEQYMMWHKLGYDHGTLSLNLSIKHLESKEYIDTLVENLDRFSFKHEFLELEILEREVMKNPAESIMKLRKINSMGIKISIDDFGTGYSSLSYLKRLPIDKLKIDQSFIRNLPDDSEDAAIVKAIIALADSLGLDKLAEGIETKEQRDFIIKAGCTKIQGYYYSKPISAKDIESKYFI